MTSPSIYIHHIFSTEKKLFNKLGCVLTPYPEKADIICFTGGGDIHPQYYNQKVRGSIAGDYPQYRTETEIILYNEFKNTKKFVGICRGMQLLNILKGGTLLQHVEDHNGIMHDIYINGIKKGEVNSFHHQCISSFKDGNPPAFSVEGIIEAMTWKNSMGVQWHPEWAENEKDFSFTYFKQLFEELINKL